MWVKLSNNMVASVSSIPEGLNLSTTTCYTSINHYPITPSHLGSQFQQSTSMESQSLNH